MERPYCIPLNNPDEWTAHLREEGFVCITGVVTPAQCVEAQALFEQHFGVGKKLYTDGLWPLGDKGMVVEGDIASSDFSFFSRSQPNVRGRYHQSTNTLFIIQMFLFKAIYERLYNGETDLVSAFDRANAVRNAPNSNDTRGWLHIDYPVNNPPPFTCYQSFLNYIDCTPSDSPCLRVIPKTHTGELCDAIVKDIKSTRSSRDSAFFRVKFDESQVLNVVCAI
jgi:hypothetical protein